MNKNRAPSELLPGLLKSLCLRLKFESEQPAFLEEKIRALEFIRNEQKDCGVDVTVQDEEVDKVKKQLEELKLKTVTTEEY